MLESETHSEHYYDYTRNDPNRENPFMNGTMEPYPDEMFEEAERREKENQEHQLKTIDEMTREERVNAAIEEVWWLVRGGQDGREYANSILFIVRVLESLK